MTIATTIWSQISRNTKMACGARNPTGNGNALTFAVTIRPGKSYWIRVTLQPTDTYTVELVSNRGVNVKTENELDNIYADNLSEVIYNFCNR